MRFSRSNAAMACAAHARCVDRALVAEARAARLIKNKGEAKGSDMAGVFVE